MPMATPVSTIGATLLEVHSTEAIGGKLAALGGALVVNSSEHAEPLNAAAVAARMQNHWP